MSSPFLDRDFESIRSKAYALRHNYFDDMEKHLLTLENSLHEKGLNVVWIKDLDSLVETVQNQVNELQVNRIGFDTQHPLESHITGRFEKVPLEVAEKSSDDLDLLVLDADFAVCDSGSLVFMDRKSACCFNKVKNMVVIVNIDQVISNKNDLSFFISLKNCSKDTDIPKDLKIIQHQLQYVQPSDSSYASDQMYTQEPMKITVVFYMNGIEGILSSESDILKESLYCINCGRCLEVCPAANATLNEEERFSPIELVKLNSLDSYNRTQHLFSHTTLCGACDCVCPVKIPLVKLLLFEMQVSNTVSKNSRAKQLFNIFRKRGNLNKFNNSFFRFFFVKRFLGKNKSLSRYFSGQNGDFFNITFEPPYEENPNEILKNSDIE